MSPEDEIRAEIGECTVAPDHEDRGGMCIHCGAEFDDPEEPGAPPS